VTALAAVQKLKADPNFTGNPVNIMGISMGSSEGGGYANGNGTRIRGPRCHYSSPHSVLCGESR
jgi:hypothetical protein